jgi:hypothetical protein
MPNPVHRMQERAIQLTRDKLEIGAWVGRGIQQAVTWAVGCVQAGMRLHAGAEGKLVGGGKQAG